MVQVGTSSSPPTTVLQGPVRPRPWALRLPGYSHPAAPSRLDSLSQAGKPHRADSISHLARSRKEGLGSWGLGPGAWD